MVAEVNASNPNAKNNLLCVGVIGAARGLRGDLRVKSFTQDLDAIGSYGPLTDATGTKTFKVKVIGQQKGQVLVRIQGVNDRDAADAMKGQELYVARDRLPQPDEDEFYFSDLIGLDAELTDGSPFGQVVEAEDHGAGAFLEVMTKNHGRVLVPFTKACVPEVDIAGGKLVIDPPDGLLQPGEPEPQDGEGERE